MAARDGSEDYDALLAEVARSLQAGAPHPAALPPASAAASTTGRSSRRRRRPSASALPAPAAQEVARAEVDRLPASTRALIAGVIAAALVFMVFLVLPIPFLGEWSGAAGAFLGAAGTALLLRRR